MYILYWSHRTDQEGPTDYHPDFPDRRQLTFVGQVGEFTVLKGPVSELFLQRTATLLREERLVSAAVVDQPLEPDKLWVATEWLGQMAVAIAVHPSPLSSGAIVKYPWLNKELGHEASDAGRSVA
jgi:hypothetical protein